MTTRPELPDLPVRAVLPELGRALEGDGRAVLAAPPGAGKTTLVPLFLLDAPWRGDGTIVLVEPRRLAARAAARRMAALLGEEAGGTVGYRMRLDSRAGGKTRILVVTEGVFTRMALDDPELAGVAAVLFDEFHERALDADFGLALALDIRSAFRPDLRLMVMSATLDTARVARLLGGAPVIASEGRAFPVEIRYRERPAGEPVEAAVASAIVEAHRKETGSILAFLPGQREIERTFERLEGRFGPETVLAPLYGRLDARAQDRAIRPAPPGQRKIVLSTAVAETSITIDGVRIVIDGGLSRQPVHEPATGITRLETVRVSRASAEQRAGRAGRTEPGIAVRLWRQEQTAALPAFSPPEILSGDLTGLVLDCAAWGVSDPAALAFIDPPPAAALAEARTLLAALGALDAGGRLTERGRLMRSLALPARLAAVVVSAAERGDDVAAAARLAVLVGEPGLGGASLDLDDRLRRFAAEPGERAKAARALAARTARRAGGGTEGRQPGAAGELLLEGFSDRIAMQRGGRGRFVLANGRGAVLEETERLAGAPFLVVVDLTGRAAAQRVLAAAEIDRATLEERLAGRIETIEETSFDTASRSVRARRRRRFGALVLEETALPTPSGEAAAAGLADGIRALGLEALPWSRQAAQLRDRLAFLHRTLGGDWPSVTDASLLAGLETWFTPFQSGVTRLDAVSSGSLVQGLTSLVPHALQRDLDRLAPTHFEVPTGSRIALRYDEADPVLSVRVQELFGLPAHPAIAGGRFPLVVELLSPAHRPIQTTRDLPGFWTGSWREVRSEMRGRYPKHVWPEDPLSASPTVRAKPRGT
ncbi:MAG: ATP-dependent helicase HrpB [Pararhizobium sp.]